MQSLWKLLKTNYSELPEYSEQTQDQMSGFLKSMRDTMQESTFLESYDHHKKPLSAFAVTSIFAAHLGIEKEFIESICASQTHSMKR